MARTSSARWYRRAALPCCMAILVSAATAISVDAATITVNSFNQIDPGQCTIAVAISSMNAGADQVGCTHVGTYGTSDTIVLAAGTYALTTADNGTNAYPVIQVAVTINGNGATLSRTVGNVAPFFRFFEVQAGGLTISNVTLTGGNVPGGDGGAILSRSGPLIVSGATFSGNSASGGDWRRHSPFGPSKRRASARRRSPTTRSARTATGARSRQLHRWHDPRQHHLLRQQRQWR